jgi:hypothetical protein
MKERKFLYMLRRGETCKRLFISTAAPHGQQEEKRRRKETHTHTRQSYTHCCFVLCVFLSFAIRLLGEDAILRFLILLILFLFFS